MRRRMVGLRLYEDEIRSVEGPDARCFLVEQILFQ